MSVADIKREAIHLTAEERWEVATFLQDLNRKEESKELARICADMEAGNKVPLEELIRRHEALLAEGR